MMNNPPIKKYNPVNYYFIADPSFWPIIGSIGLFTTFIGLVQTLHHGSFGPYLMGLGVMILLTTMFGWFGKVIHESKLVAAKKVEVAGIFGRLWDSIKLLFE